jgi:hypothetical protein
MKSEFIKFSEDVQPPRATIINSTNGERLTSQCLQKGLSDFGYISETPQDEDLRDGPGIGFTSLSFSEFS